MNEHPILDRKIVGVIAATNASPIEIETDAVHGLTTGDTVTTNGVAGNTNANVADSAVTVVSTTKFTIDNSAGNASHFPIDSGQVEIDHTSTTWNAVTAQEGTVRQFNLVKHDDKVKVIVTADNDPSGGGSAGVRVKLWGRAGVGGWVLVTTIDESDTWVANPDDSKFVSYATTLEGWPEMRLDVVAFATSTNKVRAWLVE